MPRTPTPSLRCACMLVLVTALASGGCSLRPMTAEEAGDGRGRVLTAEEIQQSGAQSAWDAIKLLSGAVRFDEDRYGNPTGMGSRGQSSIHLGTTPLVFMDGVRMADYRVLERLPATDLLSIRFLSGPDATTYYGTDAGNGVFLIATRDREEHL